MKWMSLSVVMIGLAVASGCNNVKAPIQPQMDPYGQSQVHVADKDLKRLVPTGVPIAARDNAGLLHVTIPIRAATDKEIVIDYRATFFDYTGTQISQTSWMAKHLNPNIYDEIHVNSMSPNAAQFRIDIRQAK